MTVQFITGDCREKLAELPDQSVHCCVTSPPYFGLRDYGVDGQIGLEQSPDGYIYNLVAALREVRRALRDDGTLWLNLGDTYSSGGRGGNPTEKTSGLQGGQASQRASMVSRRFREAGLPPKNVIGIPWKVAFALQADGWLLRQDIIWSKKNVIPESVRDRCTKSHEYIFLLAKQPDYYFDNVAIAEPSCQKYSDIQRAKITGRGGQSASSAYPGCPQRDKSGGFPVKDMENPMRNKRSVWTVATQPFKEAHFATFPPALIEPCILAGCPEGGTVLDPFGGAGTTGLVADRLQRNAILIELNEQYTQIAKRRIYDDAPLFGVPA